MCDWTLKGYRRQALGSRNCRPLSLATNPLPVREQVGLIVETSRRRRQARLRNGVQGRGHYGRSGLEQ